MVLLAVTVRAGNGPLTWPSLPRSGATSAPTVVNVVFVMLFGVVQSDFCSVTLAVTNGLQYVRCQSQRLRFDRELVDDFELEDETSCTCMNCQTQATK